MNRKKHRSPGPGFPRILIFLVVTFLGCGGDDTFVLLNPQVRFQGFRVPTPRAVTLVEGMYSISSTGGSVFVNVVVTDTNNIFGVDFDLLYDSANFSLVGSDEGNFLTEGGTVLTRLVIQTIFESSTVTRIIVAHSRFGVTTTDLNAVGGESLLALEFESRTANPVTSALLFDGSIRAPRVFSKDGAPVVEGKDFHGGELFVELNP